MATKMASIFIAAIIGHICGQIFPAQLSNSLFRALRLQYFSLKEEPASSFESGYKLNMPFFINGILFA